jgi:hypothetical protein
VREKTEKDFFLQVSKEKRVREKTEKERGMGLPLIGAIIRENSNLSDRAPSKQNCNFSHQKLAHRSLFLETFSIESSVADNFKKNNFLFYFSENFMRSFHIQQKHLQKQTRQANSNLSIFIC